MTDRTLSQLASYGQEEPYALLGTLEKRAILSDLFAGLMFHELIRICCSYFSFDSSAAHREGNLSKFETSLTRCVTEALWPVSLGSGVRRAFSSPAEQKNCKGSDVMKALSSR